MLKSPKSLGLLLFLAIFGLTLASYPQFSEPSFVDVDEDLSRLAKAVNHNTYDNIPEPQLIDVDEDLTNFGEGRTLATATYSNLRIYPIYSRLDDATVEFQNYMKNDLVPPILDYFQGALKVKAPISGKLSFKSSVTTLCGLTTPPELFTGVAADLAYFFTINPMEDSSTVASSYACFLASGTSRPIVATAYFNTVIFKATTDVLLHEKNTYMLMHEITHALGFATSLYKYYLDANGKTLSGHIKSGTLDGGETTSIVLDVEPLTSKIRNFFGCQTIEGAYMENGGSSGTAGTHFEKRHFIFEAMSSPLVYQQSYSEFTLALLEGTGWYIPDYTYADPYWFGQGEGCGFLMNSCPNTNYDEWCSGTARGCTAQGRGAGTCSADIRSDSCRYQYPNVNYDCENSDAGSYGRYANIQSFGRDQGSKCFTGTLSETSTSDTSTTFCFKYQCVGSGLSTTLKVFVNNVSYTCKYKGIYRPAGYKGYFDCPDPLTFCSTVGAPTCPRGCMGRGTCVNGACQCKTGYTGKDCGLNV